MKTIMNSDILVSEYGRLITSRGLANSNKIILLFQKWVYEFQIAVDDSRQLPENCIDLFGAVSRQDDLHFGFTPARSKGIVKYMLWHIARWLPLQRGVVSGGLTSFVDRFRWLVTKAKIDSVGWSVDVDFRDEFLSTATTVMDVKTFKSFSHAIPSVFFCKVNKNGNLLPRKYIGSASVFSDLDLSKILFVDSPVEFIGICHGGYYGEFLNNAVEKFEVSFGDEFFYWGLGHKNIQQNRFQVLPPCSKTASSAYWVGNITPNCYIKSFFEGYDLIFDEAADLLSINYPCLSSLVRVTFLRHPREPQASEKYGEVKTFSSLAQDEIDNSVFVIDSPGSTFMYMAIYQNIPFVLVYKRSWRQFHSLKYREFLDFLEAESLIFYWDDEDTVLDYFTMLSGSISYPGSLFKKCRNWLENA